MTYTEQKWQYAERRVEEYLLARYPDSRFEYHRWETVDAIAAFGNNGERLEFYMSDLTKGLLKE